jgi:hypothetical protein
MLCRDKSHESDIRPIFISRHCSDTSESRHPNNVPKRSSSTMTVPLFFWRAAVWKGDGPGPPPWRHDQFTSLAGSQFHSFNTVGRLYWHNHHHHHHHHLLVQKKDQRHDLLGVDMLLDFPKQWRGAMPDCCANVDGFQPRAELPNFQSYPLFLT